MNEWKGEKRDDDDDDDRVVFSIPFRLQQRFDAHNWCDVKVSIEEGSLLQLLRSQSWRFEFDCMLFRWFFHRVQMICWFHFLQ
jgi:hypothetical protein